MTFINDNDLGSQSSDAITWCIYIDRRGITNGSLLLVISLTPL